MNIPVAFRGHLLTAILILAGAAASLGALSPAASDEVRQYLQAMGIISCSRSGPCQEAKNAGTGSGLEGISANGKGVIGQTTFTSTSAANGQAGVLGQDLSTSGTNDVGVQGSSTNGTGVAASSTNGKGMIASSINGVGLNVSSTNDPALIATSTNTDSIGTFTTHNSATSGVGRSAIFASDSSTDGGHLNWGVLGASANGIGVEGTASNWVGVNAVGGGFDSNTGLNFPALSIVGDGRDLIDACGAGTSNPCNIQSAVFEVGTGGLIFTSGGFETPADVQGHNFSSSGSVEISGSGQYIKNGTCVAGCSVATPTSAGRAVTTYAPMVSQPTIEDFGEAQLVDGRAFVQLSPDFANVVDQRAAYLVFITPEGDANLYVSSKTRNGFEVGETHGGRSTIAFSYRIIAKPFGSHEARLPMVQLPRQRDRRLSDAQPRD